MFTALTALRNYAKPLLLFGVLGAGVVLWFAYCRTPQPPGRIILTAPIKGYTAPPRQPVTLPDAPDVLLGPGPTIPIQTLVPKSKQAQRYVEKESGLDLDTERVVARKDLPKVPQGGTVIAHVPTEGGPVELTVIARPESWSEWDPTWEVGLVSARELGLDSDWGPLGWVYWSPGRVWKIHPVVGGMLGEHVCPGGCVVAGGVARF